MSHYKLYNKETEKDLIHPKIGLWNTTDLAEARELRDEFRAYLKKLGLSELMELIVVKDVDLNLEID